MFGESFGLNDRVNGMDILLGLIQAAITVGAIALVIILVAALFPIVFSLGTGIDKRINNQ